MPFESMLSWNDDATVAKLYTVTDEVESMFKIWDWQLLLFKQA